MTDITLSIGVTRKVNLGNYESADVFVNVSNIPVDATETDIMEALSTGEIAFEAIKAKTIALANEMRVAGRGGRTA